MASYSIKLVDHTASSSKLTPSIQSELQSFFTRVFKDTSDSATVGWGKGAASDRIVLHFVEDVASSYIVKTMKRPPKINPGVGGHTTLRGKVICSEFYKTLAGRDGTPSGLDYAKLAFHECLHNVWPTWTEQDLMGKGGLADTPVGPDLNDRDKDLMRRGIATDSGVTQQL